MGSMTRVPCSVVFRLLSVALAVLALALAGCIQPTPAQRAISLAHMQRVDQGIVLLRDAIQKHPDDVDSRRVLVRLLGLSGDLASARKEAEDLQKLLHEGDPSGWLELGHAYELAHRFDEALKAYDTAASVAPGSPAGPLEGGMRCAHWGEVEEARPRLEEAVKRGANDADVWHALGLVRLHQKDLEGATEAYKKGLEADGSRPENWLGLASVAVVKEDAKGALEAYSALLTLRPNYGAAELGRAWALAKLGRSKEALAALDHAEALGAPRANVARQRAALGAPAHPSPRPASTSAPSSGASSPPPPVAPGSAEGVPTEAPESPSAE
jgi:tetratricopeptide (TPR) repeat protein